MTNAVSDKSPERKGLNWRLVQAALLFGRSAYHFTTEGMEHLPKRGACILTANHHGVIGELLLICALLMWREPGTAAGFFASPVWRSPRRSRPLLRLLGPSDRPLLIALSADKAGGGRSRGDREQALALLAQGVAVGIAAEGELSWDGQLQPLKPGTAWLALHSGVPVIPVVTMGGYDAMPRWSQRPKLTGRVTLRVGQPFYIHPLGDEITHQDIANGSQEIWQHMHSLLEMRG